MVAEVSACGTERGKSEMICRGIAVSFALVSTMVILLSVAALSAGLGRFRRLLGWRLLVERLRQSTIVRFRDLSNERVISRPHAGRIREFYGGVKRAIKLL